MKYRACSSWLVVGPSMQGKTSLVCDLLVNAANRFEVPISEIVFCHSVFNKNDDSYKRLERDARVPVTFRAGFPTPENFQNGEIFTTSVEADKCRVLVIGELDGFIRICSSHCGCFFQTIYWRNV